MATKTDEPFDSDEIERRYRAMLAGVLATPPDHKTKAKLGASPKKRGRPPKISRETSADDA